jgi:hypothetical protein
MTHRNLAGVQGKLSTLPRGQIPVILTNTHASQAGVKWQFLGHAISNHPTGAAILEHHLIPSHPLAHKVMLYINVLGPHGRNGINMIAAWLARNMCALVRHHAQM